MASASDETTNFVQLIENNKDILSKSQLKVHKIRKAEASDVIVNEWKKIFGKKLTQATLLKKLNNIKSTAKCAFDSGKPLVDWQRKILDITVSYTPKPDPSIQVKQNLCRELVEKEKKKFRQQVTVKLSMCVNPRVNHINRKLMLNLLNTCCTNLRLTKQSC